MCEHKSRAPDQCMVIQPDLHGLNFVSWPILTLSVCIFLNNHDLNAKNLKYCSSMYPAEFIRRNSFSALIPQRGLTPKFTATQSTRCSNSTCSSHAINGKQVLFLLIMLMLLIYSLYIMLLHAFCCIALLCWFSVLLLYERCFDLHRLSFYTDFLQNSTRLILFEGSMGTKRLCIHDHGHFIAPTYR